MPSRVTQQSARTGMVVFASASAIGFGAAVVAAPYAHPDLTIAGAIVAAVVVAIAVPALRRPHVVLRSAVVVLYYTALTLALLGESGRDEGLLVLAAIPVIASALYGPRSLTAVALVAATATLACDGIDGALSAPEYAQLLIVWPITGVGIAYAVHQLRSQLERTVMARETAIEHDATLALIADELYSIYDSDQVLSLGLQSAARLTDVPGGQPSSAVFFLVEGDRATLVASYSPDQGAGGEADPRIGRLSIPLSLTLKLRAAVANHEDRLFVLNQTTPVPPGIAGVLAELKIENAIVQLMRVGDAASGLLAVFNTDAAATEYNLAQRDWLQGLAPLLELALSRAFVFEAQTTTDPLTGIANRREVDLRLARMPRSVMYSLLAVDIDKLKSVNDTYGHHAGDELIRVVADALKRAIRRGDVAARIGGDEFCVIIADADGGRAEMVANRILTDLGERTIHGQRPRISVGIAPFASGRDSAARQAAADLALYQAKRTGGNRVVRAPVLGVPGGGATKPAERPSEGVYQIPTPPAKPRTEVPTPP
jgi:diguanylate cyclase (GGDEF)-like protein